MGPAGGARESGNIRGQSASDQRWSELPGRGPRRDDRRMRRPHVGCRLAPQAESFPPASPRGGGRSKRAPAGCVQKKLRQLTDGGRGSERIEEADFEALAVSLWDEAAPGLASHHQALTARARAGRPTELPDVLTQMLSRISRGGSLPFVQPSVGLMRLHGRNTAQSTRNSALVEWLASKAGKEWSAERHRLVQHDVPDAVIISTTSGAASSGATSSRAIAGAPAAQPTVASSAASSASARGRGRGRADGMSPPRAAALVASARGRGRGRGGRMSAPPPAEPPSDDAPLRSLVTGGASKKRRV